MSCEEGAELALAELARTGAFDRSHLLLARRPVWLADGQRGRGVPEHMHWRPLITVVQTAMDAANAMVSVPGEFGSFGHDYRADMVCFVRDAYAPPADQGPHGPAARRHPPSGRTTTPRPSEARTASSGVRGDQEILLSTWRAGMTDTSADGAPPPAIRRSVARRRSAGIYGTIVASAVLAAGGAHLRTVPLAVTVVVTLLVYWAAEGYAELLGEHAHAGRLPTWGQVRASLAAIWPMVSASYVPLLALLAARVLGADTRTAATVALAVAIALLLLQGWVGGKASQLRGLRLLAVTLIAGAFGVVMILLKLLVTH